MPLESAPPFIIITLGMAAMGGLQALVQKGFYGKPKPVLVDDWDRKVMQRDQVVLDEYKKLKAEGKGA
ncbi:hypothetical protein WJX72_002573 [[Myrmecia] bisecta]|uniref:NADH dehydrogenase [ubiquinone] 1 alpha subcomplex subunit 1 n=1 Tax=[Myrmecia] bisecta TaxID=41462 RepID=A0AAW1PVD8_9CHLO